MVLDGCWNGEDSVVLARWTEYRIIVGDIVVVVGVCIVQLVMVAGIICRACRQTGLGCGTVAWC